MSNLEYIKEKLKNSFDVKYRKINTVLGSATIVFIDDLCNARMISQYVVSPLRKIEDSQLNAYKITTVEEIIENLLEIYATGIAKDVDDAIMHILSGDPIVVFDSKK